MFLVVAAYGLSKMKAARFNNDCIHFENLLKSSPVTQGAYNEISKAYDEIDCFNDQDRRRKRSLWLMFQYKFRNISPYTVKEVKRELTKTAS
jgi:hypothetical protein